jgi:hypothetical protein
LFAIPPLARRNIAERRSVMRKWTGIAAACAVVGALVVSAAPAARAKGGDKVKVAGTCTKASSAKLTLSGEDARIQVEFEVDQNRVGVRWAVVIRQNGTIVRKLTKVTKAPSGSFTARFLAANRTGKDKFVVTGKRSGEACTARASF